MQFWRGAEFADRVAGEPHHGRWRAGGDHHGLRADRERAAIRRVHEPVESGGGGGDRGGARRIDADAVRAGAGRDLDRRRADGADREYAGAEQ